MRTWKEDDIVILITGRCLQTISSINTNYDRRTEIHLPETNGKGSKARCDVHNGSFKSNSYGGSWTGTKPATYKPENCTDGSKVEDKAII